MKIILIAAILLSTVAYAETPQPDLMDSIRESAKQEMDDSNRQREQQKIEEQQRDQQRQIEIQDAIRVRGKYNDR